MSALLNILRERRLWPLWLVLLATLLLLPRLGTYGFWEPQEMEIASRALPESEEVAEARRKAEELRKRQNEDKAKPAPKKKKSSRPPLDQWLVEESVDALGTSELSARLPYFFLALFTILATYFLGCRVRGPTTGLFGALILLSSPLFVFQARQITSDMAAICAATLLVLGALGLCARGRPKLWLAVDSLLLIAGAGLGHYSVGFLLGVVAPLGGIALACLLMLPSPGADLRRLALALLALLAVASFVYLLLGAFELVDARDEEVSFFGKIFHSESGYQPLLAGHWKTEGSLKSNVTGLFEQVAFGLFPWICLAPIALFALLKKEQGIKALGPRMLFGWAVVTWMVAAIAQRKLGPVQFAALPALALLIAAWLDELTSEQRESGYLKNLVPPLVALFAFFTVIVLSKDIKAFPATFLSLHLDRAISKFPAGVKLQNLVLVIGGLFALVLVAAMTLNASYAAHEHKPQRDFARRFWLGPVYRLIRHWRALRHFIARERLLKFLLPACFAISLGFGFFLSQVWTPSMATKLSSKATFSVYHHLRESGNTLGIVGTATSGSRYYAGGDFETLKGRAELFEFLKRPERVFALVRASELCPIHKESSRQDFDYYVVDDSNAERVMLSNRMWNENVQPPQKLHALMRTFLDENPLSRYIIRERPTNIRQTLSINFDDKIELIGIDLPAQVDRGDTFEVTLYMKVLKPIKRNWQVFMHFDGGGVRFQGDHYPVKKRCGTNYWQPGDYVVDKFEVEAGSLTHPKTVYKVWTGFFVGSSGNWENMVAKSGHPDDNNRVQVGTLRLK